MVKSIATWGYTRIRGAMRMWIMITKRNHQGLGNTLIEPSVDTGERGPVKCRERQGGVLELFYREAA